MDFEKLTSLEYKGAIIGMVLGDGYIGEHGFKTSSISQEYIKMKERILQQLTATSIYKDEKRTGSFGKKPLYELRGRQHPLYQKFRMRFYPNGRKQVSEYVLKTLNSLGLLFWYLDDGCLDSSGGGIRFQIWSCEFTEIENIYIQKILNDRFGLRFNLRKQFKKETGKIYYWLYLKAIDRLVFWDKIIKPFLQYIPQEMMYKIPTRESIESKIESKKHERFYKNIV